MTDSSWNECIENNSARKVSIDNETAKSLIETARERIAVINEVNERNCNFVFEDYYTSVLEFLQALVKIQGFNVLNHICLGFYLRDVLKNEKLFRLFDEVRYRRNSLTYYGRRADFETAKDSIEKCKQIISGIEKEIKL